MKQITRTLTLVLTLTTLLCVTLIPAQAAAYSAELDFLDKATYESYIVFNNGLKAAGDSTKMGYKGWISSTNKSGTTVFAFKAEEGKTFDSFTFTYSGYSIAVEETDIYDIYVSTTAEDWSDPALVYNEKDWTLVSRSATTTSWPAPAFTPRIRPIVTQRSAAALTSPPSRRARIPSMSALTLTVPRILTVCPPFLAVHMP